MAEVTMEQTAYHEAGHAVVAIWHDVGIDEANIITVEDRLGVVRHSPTPGWFKDIYAIGNPETLYQRTRLESHLVILFAGQEAQRRFSPQSHPDVIQAGAEGDMEQVEHILDLIYGGIFPEDGEEAMEERLAAREFASIRARLLVTRLWAGIHEIAQLLLERQSVSESDIVSRLRERRLAHCFGYHGFELPQLTGDAKEDALSILGVGKAAPMYLESLLAQLGGAVSHDCSSVRGPQPELTPSD